MQLTVDDFKGLFTNRQRDKIKTLMRRADYLRARTSVDSRDLSFDCAERSALEWAITELHQMAQERGKS
jgi:hypothetical protein